MNAMLLLTTIVYGVRRNGSLDHVDFPLLLWLCVWRAIFEEFLFPEKTGC